LKATKTKPAEQALGCVGGILSLPALIPVFGATMGLARWSKSDRIWQRAIAVVCAVLIFPLFLIAMIIFIPYLVLLEFLAGLGLVRRELPSMLAVVITREDYWRLDLTVPDEQRELAEEIVAELRERVSAQNAQFDVAWMEEGGQLNAEISIEGNVDALCRNFVESVENEHSTIEVHWV